MAVPNHVIEYLRNTALDYKERTAPHFPKAHAWRELNNDDIWKLTIYQVAVVGNSSSYDRLINSNEAQQKLNFEYFCTLDTEECRLTINRMLRCHGVRYASAEMKKCRKTSSILKNFIFLRQFDGGPIGYTKFLETLNDDRSKISRVEHDLCYIKLKGARDLLAELGIARYLIALDYRILTILAKLGVSYPQSIKTNKLQYLSLEDELLQHVCLPIGITGVELDRILYWNYNEIIARL
ncbi:MAG: hypothetical protein A2W25_16420 [candidate division Zixibacteria bacterium RBG_16_53_22]|nr:MAG: hypothetical protein A2W25_16420 [candidate division Zixibacteria bacterium RBG_16_53_22]